MNTPSSLELEKMGALEYDQVYLRNKRLPRSDAEFTWTSEMLSEMKKSQESLRYFAEHYFFIVTTDEGREKIKLYPKQKRILKALEKNRFVVVCSSRQAGKALDIDTPIPTPNGWKKLVDIKDNDIIFGSNGQLIRVIKAHDIMYNRPCYEVIFDNGEKIIADEEHNWFTQNVSERHKKINGSKKTTKQIFDTLNKKGSNEPNHRIPLCVNGVNYTEKQLAIHPYVLGLWLGDGCSEGGYITADNRDVKELYQLLKDKQKQFDNITVHKYGEVYSIRISVYTEKKTGSLNTLIKELNLWNNKHIPDEYMLSSRSQRIDLLQGLIDSDGYVTPNGMVYFYNTNLNLAKQVKQLIESLGYKTFYKEYTPSCNGITCALTASVSFTAREYVCNISFKKNRIKLRPRENISKFRNDWHYIKNIIPVTSVPVRCLTVDSPDELFICSNSFILTHNTTIMTIYALWFTCFNSDKRIVIVANKESTAIMILRRIKLAYEELPNWLKPGIDQWGKTEVIFGNGSSIAISTTTGSAVRGDTVNCIIIDEAAAVPDHLMRDFWGSVIPVISSSRKRTTKIFAVSTPKGTGNKFYELYNKASQGENTNDGLSWHSERIDWWEIPGRGKLWKQEMLTALGDEQLFNQEFNNEFLDTGESAVDKDIIKTFEDLAREPQQLFEDGHYKVWFAPQIGHLYGIGVDVGEGIGRAASTAQILDFTDLNNIEQVAIYHNNLIHPLYFAEVLNRIGHHWGCPPMLIERNNCGGQVIDELQKTYGYQNVVSYNPDKMKYADLRPGIYSHTNIKYRGVMNMRYWVNTLKVVNIYDVGTIGEMKTFVRYPNGTWKKKEGENVYDDRILALIWALFILEEEIVGGYYDVAALDDHGKPLKLIHYTYEQPSFFALDNFYQNDQGAPLPSFFGVEPDIQTVDMDNFYKRGWKQYGK